MRPIIGIIMRNGVSDTFKNIGISYDDIVYSVIKSGGIPVIIPNDNINLYLNLCSGFILQGGDDVCDNNLKLLKLFMDNDIPTLGICLGMQEMAVLNDGILFDVSKHSGDILHEITIKNNSLLYKILGVSKTIVNSRHKSAVLSTKMDVGSVSMDNVIESVEIDDLTFFLGVQWHPESMYDSDINSRKIFDYFIKICNDISSE